MRTQRGFGLVHLIALLALVSVVIASSIWFMQRDSERAARERMVNQMAEEYAIIANGASQFFKTYCIDNAAANSGTAYCQFDSRTTTIPRIFSLFLEIPDGYAGRDGGFYQLSPIGDAYSVYTIRDGVDEDIFRVLLTTQGSPMEARLRRVGADLTNAAITGLLNEVAERLMTEYRHSAGVVQPGTKVAVGPFAGGTLDLTDYLPSAPNKPILVLMSGWPEFDPNYKPPVLDGPPQYETCLVRDAHYYNGNQVDGECPPDYEQIAEWVTCQGWVPENGTIVASTVGTFRFYSKEVLSDGRAECGGLCSVAALEGQNTQYTKKCGSMPASTDPGDPTSCSIYEGELIDPSGEFIGRPKGLFLTNVDGRLIGRGTDYVTDVEVYETTTLNDIVIRKDKYCGKAYWETRLLTDGSYYMTSAGGSVLPRRQGKKDRYCCLPRTP